MARDMAPEAEVADKVSAADEVRAKWIGELRRQGHRQCEGLLCKWLGEIGLGGKITEVCAIGLLGETTGLPLWWDMQLEDIGALAGLNEDQIDEVINRNDGASNHTFAEIADVVEGWFK